jgi:hypothetical protein
MPVTHKSKATQHLGREIVLKQYSEKVYEANISGSYNIDLVNGNVQILTLIGNATLGFANERGVGFNDPLKILIKQDATGGRTTAWTGAVTWISTTPVYNTAANNVEVFTLFTPDGGITWYGLQDSIEHAVSGAIDAGDITSGTFADARIAQSNITQHQAALSITESQISDLQPYLLDTTDTFTGVLTVAGSAAIDNITVDGNVISSTDVNGNITLTPNGTGEVIVSSNLTVSGTTTTVNSNEVNIADAIITLNSDEAGTPSADAGLEIERGTSTNARFLFEEASDLWKIDPGTGTLSEILTTLSTLDADTLDGIDSTGFALASHVHDTADITTGTFADARVAASNVTQHQAALSVTESQISDLQNYLLDTTDTFTGALTVTGSAAVDNVTIDGNAITSTDTNGDLTLTPNGTGNLILDGQNWPQADGTINQVLKTDGSGQLSWVRSSVGSSVGFKGARLVPSTNQTFSSSTGYVTVPFATTVFDTNTFTSGNTFVVPEPGYYQFSSSIFASQSALSNVYLRIIDTTNTEVLSIARDDDDNNTTRTDHCVSTSTGPVYLDTGTVVEVQFDGNVSSTVTLKPGTFFGVAKVETATMGSSFSGARVNASTFTLGVTSTYFDVIFNASAVYDTDNYYVPGTSTTNLVIPVDGYYSIAFGGYFKADGGTALKAFRIQKNGSEVISGEWVADPASAGYEGGTTYGESYFEAGDTVNVQMKGNSGDKFYTAKIAIHRLSTAAAGFSGAQAVKNADQSFTTGTLSLVTYATEQYDTDDYHDNSTNNERLTAPSAGYYLCTANAAWDSNATGYRELVLCKNGNTNDECVRDRQDAAGSVHHQTVSHIFNLAAGDYVTVHGRQTSGGNLNIIGGNENSQSRFSMTKLTGVGVESLAGLSDVAITANTAGEIIKWDGTNWINNTLAEAGIAADSHVHDTADVTTGTFADARIAASNVTQHQAALSVTESQISDLQSYSLTSHNHTLDGLSNTTITTIAAGEIIKWDGAAWINNTLAEAGAAATSHVHDTADVTTGTFADARIAATNVTQHVASIDHDSLLNFVAAEHLDWSADLGATNLHVNNITAAGVTQHQAALSVTESQISDLQSYLLDTTDTFTGTMTVTGDLQVDNININGNNITTTTGNITIDPAGAGTTTITGDLIVDGTTTTTNSNEVNIGDAILTLNYNEAGTPSQNAGIEIERGTSANVQFLWNETTDAWEADGNRLLTTADEGTGNGLDADTLDGLDSLQFLRSDEDDILNGHTIGRGGGDISTNIAFGTSALGANTTGLQQIAIGTSALAGGDNSNSVAIGHEAMSVANGALENTVVGSAAGKALTSGDFNVFIGRSAGNANTTASRNTAVGRSSLSANITGTSNVAIGSDALLTNDGSFNTAVGANAIEANVSGTSNTGIGYNALLLSTANQNTAVGSQAGDALTTGGENTCIGYNAMSTNITGIRNTAIGVSAMSGGDGGDRNTAVGRLALQNVTGNSNVAIGNAAGQSITSGQENTIVGDRALDAETTGSDNVAIGELALTAQNGADGNVGIGLNAGAANTTGSRLVIIGGGAGDASTTAADITAVGYNALTNNTSSETTAVGASSLQANTSGSNNTAVGFYALSTNTVSSYSTAVGHEALKLSTGASNTALGYGSGGTITTGSNLTCLGYNAEPSSATATNEITLGNTNVSTVRMGNGNVLLTTASIASDSNLLDGLDSSQFLRSDAADTATGLITFTGGISVTTDITLTGTGRIQGIDTVSAATDAANKSYVDAQVAAGGGATGGGSDEVFYENDTNVTTNYTITSGKNALSAGPITVDTGVTVTVPSGSTWTVV